MSSAKLRYVPLVQYQFRCISSGDLFGKTKLSEISLPELPMPPAPKPTIEELVASGESVVREMGLFWWYTPPSYLRIGLEYLHSTFDLQWWATIVIGTVVLRLALFRVPILNQRNVAEMNKHMPFSDANRKKISDARAEGNKMLEAQAMMEMREYQQKQKMNPLKALWLGCGNALIFMTQYFALKKMAAANFPGFSTEGTLWFPDLTITDPYYALPAITAITTGLVIKLGIEFGFAANALQGWQRIAVQYGMPAMIFFGNWFMDFPSVRFLIFDRNFVQFAGNSVILVHFKFHHPLLCRSFPRTDCPTLAQHPRCGAVQTQRKSIQLQTNV
jgi:membrane protein insertase Oxa1/YidC/SpoIIIJ